MQKLIGEIEEVLDKIQPYNIALRVRLSKELNLNYVNDFSEGWALMPKDSRYQFLGSDGRYLRDEKGQILSFPHAQSFRDGLARVMTDGDARVKYLSHKGQLYDFGVEK